MIAVRYVALAALVVWLGGSMASVAGEIFQRLDLLSYGCGAVIIICFFIMKFMGPPPRAFLPRLGLVVLMLLVAAYAGLRHPSTAILSLNVGFGAILLFWYIRE